MQVMQQSLDSDTLVRGVLVHQDEAGGGEGGLEEDELFVDLGDYLG